MVSDKNIKKIRDLYYRDHKTVSEIAKKMRLSYNTVKKYVDMDDLNTRPPRSQTSASIAPSLEPWKQVIREALENDKKVWRKQRYTARKIFNDLKKYGTLDVSVMKAIDRGELVDPPPKYTGSYRTLDTFVSAVKREIKLRKGLKALPLDHQPGEAQGDFGDVFAIENGVKRQNIYFVLSFPHSNTGFFQMKHSKNMEALLESLQSIFEYIGGVPAEIWFDNDSVIVKEILDNKDRVTWDRFQRFQMHYRFNAVFMNQGKGNEKGNVENKVKYDRSNYMVPLPEYTSLEDLNREYLRQAWEDGNRKHYRHDATIQELFEEDRRELLTLPTMPFDTTRVIERIKADNCGRIYLGKDKCHEYSSSLDCADAYVSVKLTSDTVTILDSEGKVVVVHERLSGDKKQSRMDWGPYLKDIAHRPRSYNNTIRNLLPGVLTQYLDTCGNKERGRVLESLAKLYEEKGFDKAVSEVADAVLAHAYDPDRLDALHRSLFSDLPRMDEENIIKASESPDVSGSDSAGKDLAEFDKLLKPSGGANVQ